MGLFNTDERPNTFAMRVFLYHVFRDTSSPWGLGLVIMLRVQVYQSQYQCGVRGSSCGELQDRVVHPAP